MKSLNFVVFLFLLVLGEGIAVAVYQGSQPAGVAVGIAAIWIAGLAAGALRIANQWERIVILRLGKFSSVKGPGVFIVLPVLDRAIFVDTRTLTMDIPKQQVITKDNVPVSITGSSFSGWSAPRRPSPRSRTTPSR